MQQLTQWIMIHPERVRDKMDDHKDSEQATWVSMKCDATQGHSLLTSY